MPEIQALYRPAEVAEIFRVNPKTITRWERTGRMKAVFTPGGQRLFTADEINRLLSTNEQPIPAYREWSMETQPKEPKTRQAREMSEPAKVRQWARENGYEIGVRGVIASSIVDAYKAAQEKAEAKTVNPAVVREWAQQNGYPVGDRGRIPKSVVSDYLAATRREKRTVKK